MPEAPLMSGTLALALVLPCLAAAAVALLGRWPDVRDSVTVLFGLLTFGTVASLVPEVQAGGRPELVLLDVLPGLPLAFSVEPLGLLFGLVASGLWIVTSIYGFGYMRGHHETNQTRFFFFFALAIAGALAIAFSRNLFTLFVFYEALTLSTYPLVTHHQDAEARTGGRIYLGILMGTSVGLFLPGMLAVYALSGTLEFQAGGILPDSVTPRTMALLLGLFAFGTGKAALMPFHKWLPAAMVAPTPVSALLHAVAVVKAGVFTVLKIVVYVFGWERLADAGASDWLCAVAAITLLYTSFAALTKDHLKRRLAYSTISQLAYIVLGAALVTPASLIGSSMHIVTHAFGKITLFFCAGAILVAHHEHAISKLDGIGRVMPVTMGAFTVGALSVIGLPPMGGAWSKFHLALGAAQADQAIYVLVLMLSSLLSIGYLMPIVARAFFRAPTREDWQQGIREAPLLCLGPLCFTALGSVGLFFFAPSIAALVAPVFVAGGMP